MIRDRIRQIQAAEPVIGKIEISLFTEPAFRPDAKAMPNQQHTDQELRVNRAQQVILRHVILHRELLKQRLLLRS